MHLSKNVLFVGIISYCLMLLITQDWPAMIGNTGTVALFWLVKMACDLVLAGVSAIRIVGPSLFAEEEADDEVAIHSEDLAVSDTALYGGFMAYLLGNLGYHGYVSVMDTGATSFYFSIWAMVEAVGLIFAWILFKHAQKVQARLARNSRIEVARRNQNVA